MYLRTTGGWLQGSGKCDGWGRKTKKCDFFSRSSLSYKGMGKYPQYRPNSENRELQILVGAGLAHTRTSRSTRVPAWLSEVVSFINCANTIIEGRRTTYGVQITFPIFWWCFFQTLFRPQQHRRATC